MFLYVTVTILPGVHPLSSVAVRRLRVSKIHRSATSATLNDILRAVLSLLLPKLLEETKGY